MKHLLRSILVTLVLTATPGLSADDFPKPFNTESPDAKLMSPEDALKGMTLPDGFQVTLFAAEPDIHQPIALATDDRGRLWVAENYTYAEAATNFDSRMRDRVVILEDVDGDGRFDKRTVFWDQGRRLTSVEIGHGGVWVLDAPNLLFIPDANKDDVPDGEPVVMLNGWDDNAARHTIVNGLRWGPDGWLYGRNGIMAISSVGVPGATPDQRLPLDCGIWRFHPTRHRVRGGLRGHDQSVGHGLGRKRADVLYQHRHRTSVARCSGSTISPHVRRTSSTLTPTASSSRRPITFIGTPTSCGTTSARTA